MDLVGVTRDGRLTVLELKAQEDIHMVSASGGLLAAGPLAPCACRTSRATDIFPGSRSIHARRASCCCAVAALSSGHRRHAALL